MEGVPGRRLGTHKDWLETRNPAGRTHTRVNMLEGKGSENGYFFISRRATRFKARLSR